MTALTTNQSPTHIDARGQEAKQDFVIVYPSAAFGDLAEAVYALYYLPQNYKLVVLTDAANQAEVMRLAQDTALMDRVSFEGAARTSDRMSSFSFADVVLRQNNESFSATVQQQINLAENDSPEALASAILKAARA